MAFVDAKISPTPQRARGLESRKNTSPVLLAKPDPAYFLQCFPDFAKKG